MYVTGTLDQGQLNSVAQLVRNGVRLMRKFETLTEREQNVWFGDANGYAGLGLTDMGWTRETVDLFMPFIEQLRSDECAWADYWEHGMNGVPLTDYPALYAPIEED